MARKHRKRVPFELPAELVPDYDRWGTPEEEAKRSARSAWLKEHDLGDQYFSGWLPAYLAERRRLAGLPPRIPARRRGPLPEAARKLLEKLERDGET